jgi:hypothetical protein
MPPRSITAVSQLVREGGERPREAEGGAADADGRSRTAQWERGGLEGLAELEALSAEASHRLEQVGSLLGLEIAVGEHRLDPAVKASEDRIIGLLGINRDPLKYVRGLDLVHRPVGDSAVRKADEFVHTCGARWSALGQSFTFRPSQRTSAIECRSGPNAYVSGVPISLKQSGSKRAETAMQLALLRLGL